MGAGQQHAGRPPPAIDFVAINEADPCASSVTIRATEGASLRKSSISRAPQAKRRFGLADDLESRGQAGAAWQRRGDAAEGVFLAAGQGLRGIAGLGQRAECRAVLCGKGSSLQARQQCDQ
jgi:hypothetical protein